MACSLEGSIAMLLEVDRLRSLCNQYIYIYIYIHTGQVLFSVVPALLTATSLWEAAEAERKVAEAKQAQESATRYEEWRTKQAEKKSLKNLKKAELRNDLAAKRKEAHIRHKRHFSLELGN